MRESSPAGEAEGLGSRWDFLFYSLFSLLAFSWCLFSGQAYFDNDLLAQFGPWRAFLKDQLAQGHFPLWNPYLMGGEPFLANLQNMMFYPFNYLTLPFSVPKGFTVFFLIHFFWAAWGAHLWLRSLGLSRASSRVGALIFASSNFFWLELIHPPVLAAFSWLPWLFFSLEILARQRRPLAAFGSGLAFALLFLAGSFQVTLGALYGGAAYFLVRLFQNGRPSLKSLLLPAFLLLWGALPFLAQFIPTQEFSSLCDRGNPSRVYDPSNAQWPLHPQTLGQFLFPRYSLPPNQTLAEAIQTPAPPEKVEANFLGNFGYLGIWIPFLIWGAFRHREKKTVWLLLALALSTLGVCLGPLLPFHRLLCETLPGVSMIRVLFRFIYLYVLALSALAAFGFERWLSLSKDPTTAGTRWALLYPLALGLIALSRPAPTALEIAALLVGSLGIFLRGLKNPLLKKAGPLLFQAALVLPLLLNGLNDFHPGPSSNYDYEKNSRTIPQIAERIKPFRIMFHNDGLLYPVEVNGKKYLVNYPQNACCALEIKSFGGYNPLVLLTRRNLGGLPIAATMRLGGIKGLLTQENHGAIPDFKLESFPPFYFYEYQKPLSYAFTPAQILVIPESEKRIAFLSKPEFNPEQVAVFSGPPQFWDNPKAMTDPGLQCQILQEGANEQIFSVQLNRNHWVVFCEPMFPGWKALVDDSPTPVFTADHFLRSVYLPAGKHRVTFRFEPDWFNPIRIGLLVWTLLTFLGLLVAFRQSLLALLKKTALAVGGHGLGRIKPIRWVYDRVFNLLKPQSVWVQGHRMWLDDKDTLSLATDEVYEPVATALLKRELKPGQVVLDIGANIGYYTLLAARLVGPKGKVYAFEPDPSNFQILRKNVEANGYGNVILINKAVSNHAKSTRLYLSETNKGDHRLYDSGDGRRSVTVEVVVLDRFFKKLDKKVHFIKMDIQGAEAAALEGMKGLMRANPALKLMMEFEPSNLSRFGSDPRKVLQTLKKAGFGLRNISEKDKSVRPTDPSRLLKRYTVENGEYTNLYCVKNR